MKLDSVITVGLEELTRKQWRELFTRLTFRDADDMEVSAYQFRSGRNDVILPRGALDMLPALAVSDMRSRPVMPKRSYAKQLDAPGYEGQVDAVRAMFKAQQGQVIAPPGNGKTEICLAFAAASCTRILVVVHTQDLMKQWLDRAAVSVPGMSVGRIQGKTCQIEHLTIATAQTLKKYLQAGGKFWRQFGAVIVDEAHHAAAETWEWLLHTSPAFYRFGVTASEKRSDGRQALVRYNIGPVIHKLKFKSGVPMTVVPVTTEFRTKLNGTQYTRIVQKLVRDKERNRQIAELAENEILKGSSVLVLSRQIIHLELIFAALDPEVQKHAKIVTGKMPRHKRDELIGQLRDGTLQCILGTQLFEEGVDIPRLNRIVLAFPGTEITALQKVGRGSRQAEGKTDAIIYDMLDEYVRVLVKQWLRRRRWYRSVGIDVKSMKEVRNDQEKAQARRDKPAKSKGRLVQTALQVARPRRS